MEHKQEKKKKAFRCLPYIQTSNGELKIGLNVNVSFGYICKKIVSSPIYL